MKKIIVLISIFCCVFSASAQQPEWIIYEIAPRINDIVKNGDVIWCATEDGLLKYDLSNEKPEIYLPGDPDDYDHLVKVKIEVVYGRQAKKSSLSCQGINWLTWEFKMLAKEQYQIWNWIVKEKHGF